MATLEQERAGFALRKVEGVRDDPTKPNEKYRTQLLKLPARLHNNGLGQTAAYLRAQGSGSPEHVLCGWLQEWLRRDTDGIYPAGSDLLDAITGKAEGVAGREEALYRRASVEARALAVWLKRFAEAFLREGEAAEVAGGTA
jgi:CRISPR type III-B/RAMP module-associated protein Cmr5